MRVLVCEFVTGGGMRGEPLPASLAREGAMMRDALLHDLADLPGVTVLTTHDDRLAPPPAESRPVRQGDDVWRLWETLARDADVAWPIAPETGGLLARLARLLREAGADVIGPDDEAIAVASSKLRTAERLRAAGVPTPPAWRASEAPADAAGPFVLKPDDGAGCEATRLVARPPLAAAPGEIVQTFVPGEAASLAVLRSAGRTRLLSANRQHIAIEDGAFRFRGVTVGALADPDGRLAALAEAVGEALPGLDGLFGIDIVLGPEGPVVIEVNPRLTTAYCGLGRSLGVNALTLVPPFAVSGVALPSRPRPVEVRP